MGAGRLGRDPGLLRIGYACAWWHPREQTWSYTAARLRKALVEHAGVVDIEAQRSAAGKLALRELCRLSGAGAWQYSRAERALVDRAVRRGAGRHRPDVVLGVGEVDTPTAVPTFLYQDMTVASALASEGETPLDHVNLLPARRARLEALAAEQAERCRGSAGVFAMSEWYARILVDRLAVPPRRVWVVPAGMNNPPSSYRDPTRPAEGRILFVGTDFRRKGGDLVVEAVRRLHEGGDRPLRLTVVGPDRWPERRSPPSMVDFRGVLGPGAVSSLFAGQRLDERDSEGFEPGWHGEDVMAGGLPCVARRAFAMPEIVQEGITGLMVDSDDPDELATALSRLLDDPDVFERVAAARPGLLARFDWRASAGSIVRHMEAAVHGVELS